MIHRIRGLGGTEFVFTKQIDRTALGNLEVRNFEIEVGAMAYGCFIEATWLEVVEVEIPLPRLAREFDGYRLLQLSDIHMPDWMMTPDRLNEIVAVANQLKPDLVAITGDFVDHRPEPVVEGIVASLSHLRAIDGVVAVLGNPVGRYQVGDMVQYTNRGVGVMGWPIRFGSRPEITVFTLRAASPRFYQEQTMTDDVAISSTLIRFNKIAPSTIKLIL